jgi:hypothetical protein
MSDDIPPLGERRCKPLLATKAGLEFIMGQIAKLPTRCGSLLTLAFVFATRKDD